MPPANYAKSLSEACSDNSPRGNKSLKLRVDEYDMVKMEQILKAEIAEIDKKLETRNFFLGSAESGRAKPRKTTLSNDPTEVRHIQTRNEEQDEPLLFKKHQQVARPKSRTLSRDPREMYEIEKHSNTKNADRNFLGVIPTTAPILDGKQIAKPKQCSLTNSLTEKRNREIRLRSLSTKSANCSPFGSDENISVKSYLENDVFNDDWSSSRSGVGTNPILGVDQLRAPLPNRRRHFSNNHVEMRQIEQACGKDHGDSGKNQNGEPKPFYLTSQPVTPRGRRKTLTNNSAELRCIQTKNAPEYDEFAPGFKKEKPKDKNFHAALVSKLTEYNSNTPADHDGVTGLSFQSCPSTPKAGRKRQTTLSHHPGELQKIQQKYDLEKWQAENASEYPRTITNRCENGNRPKPRTMSFAHNDHDMKRIQARTGEVENLAQIFGLPEQRCRKLQPGGNGPAEDAVTDFLKFGKSGGGAPIRDPCSGELLTGVGGKFQRDYFNLMQSAEESQKKKEDQRRDLEEMKKTIEQNHIRRKSESRDNASSIECEDLVDKIRRLDSFGEKSKGRQFYKGTSDVTRTKMDIRYPTEVQSKEYFDALKRQEHETKEVLSNCETDTFVNGSKTTGDLLQTNKALPKETRRLKLGSNLGQPTREESFYSSLYDKSRNKLVSPYATDD